MSDETEADIRRRLCDPLAPDPVTWGRDKDLQRIAALEAQVARMTAPVTGSEAVAFTHDRLFTTAGGGGNMGALTAFLERRMKG